MADKERQVKFSITAEDRSRAAFAGVTQNLEKLQTAAEAALGGRFFSLIAGGGLVAAFAELTRSTAEFEDQIGKLSQRVGTSVEGFSALTYAGSLADVSVESLGTALKKLSVGMAETQANTGEAREAFRALGVSVTNGAGQLKTGEQVFGEIADRFERMQDSAGKTALAVKLFGRAGSDLIPLLNQGSRGLKDAADEAERFGILIGRDAAKAAEEYNDNLTRLGAAFTGFKYSIGNEAIPALNRFVEELVIASKVTGGFWKGLGLSAVTDTAKPIAALSEVTRKLENLRQLQRDLSKDTLANNINNRLPRLLGGGDLADVQRQIALLEKERELLTDLATARGDRDNFDASFNRAPPIPAPKLADGAAAAEAARIKSLFEEVRRLGEQLDVHVPISKNRDELERLKKTLEDAKKGWLTYADGVFEAADAENTALGGGESFTEFAEKLQKQTLDLIDPHRAYNRELADLQKLLDTGYLSAQQFAEAEKRLRDDSPFGKMRQDIIDLIDPFEQYRKKLEEVRKLEDQGLLTHDEATEAIFRINEQIEAVQGLDKGLKEADESARDFGHAIGTAFEDGVLEGKKFGDVVKGLEKDIARIFLRKTVTKPLEDAIGGFDIGGLFSGLLKGVSQADAPVQLGFPEFRASGGPVSAGAPYIVGELGPELFIPAGSGRIVPNGGSAAAPTVTITQNIHVDSRSDVSSVVQAMKTAKDAAVAEVFDAMRRGGSARRAVRG